MNSRPVWDGRKTGLTEGLCVSAGTLSKQEVVALQAKSGRLRSDD